MNVNCRWSGTNLVRGVFAGVVLLAAACLVLGWGSRTRQSSRHDFHPVAANPGVRALPLTLASAESQSTRDAAASALRGHALASYARLPIIFEPNVGQIDMARKQEGRVKREADAEVKFLAHGAGYSLFLTGDGATISLRSHTAKGDRSEALRMTLGGANPAAKIDGSQPLPGKTNYLIGESSEWRREIPQFARVRYEGVYPGINLVFYGSQGQLEYDFQVAAGADPRQAELKFDGPRKLHLSQGSLIVKGKAGSVRLEAPRAYQQIAGEQKPVESHFVLRGENRVGFEVGPYDRSRELVIDPILTYSTYFGGTGNETCPSFVPSQSITPGCPAIAVDGASEMYLVGATNSQAGFPVPAAGTSTQLGTNPNIYVAKLDPTGSTLLYLTFVGGGGTDASAGAAVDGAGNVYFAGTTTSGLAGTAPFPTSGTNAYQTAPASGSAGSAHVFASVLNSAGSQLTYSSYFSGNGTDVASGMTIDGNGDLYVTGTTTSTDQSGLNGTNDQFPATSVPNNQPFQTFSRAGIQFFVTKINTAAFGIGSIPYSTYFGGGTPAAGEIAIGGGIAVDSNRNIYFSGTTNFVFTGESSATDFPIVNAYQPCLNTPPPTVNTNPQTCSTSNTSTNTDAFAAKINTQAAAGSPQLLWSTYFGGSNNDSSTGIAVDAGAANVYLTGVTNSSDIIPTTTAIAFQAFQTCLDSYPNPVSPATCPTPSGATDAYVARLNNPTAAIQTLNYFSYLGGSSNDGALAITVDSANGALMTGYTQSADFPVVPAPSPIQSHLNGPQDAFLARLNTAAATGVTSGSYSTYFGGSGTDIGTSVILDSNLNTYIAGTTNSTNLQTAAPLQPANAGGYDAFATRFGTAGDLQITGVLALGTGQTFISAGNQATFTYTVTNNGPDLATNITVTDNFSPAITQVPMTFASATATSGSCSAPGSSTSVVCTIGSLQAGTTATVTIVLVPTTGGNFNGGSVVVASTNNNDPNLSNNTVTVPGVSSDFNVSISPANLSVPAAGDTATYTVILSPVPVFGASVSLSCAGTPTGASCGFQPSNTVTLNATPFAVTLNVTTTARPVTTASNKFWTHGVYALWLGIPAVVLVGIGGGNKRRRVLGMMLLCLVLFGAIAPLPACSSAKTPPVVAGTPPGTYPLTLTAASGTNSKNASFSISVP